MLARGAAQGLSDGFAALALGAHVLGVARRAPASPLELRVIATFCALCLFFACRTGADLLGSQGLIEAARLLACPLPLLALILAEGAMRRHAPVAVKAGISLGAVFVAAALPVTAGGEAWWSAVMGAYVTLSLLAITLLLVTRERASLSHQENASIDVLMLGGAGVMLLGLTDFLAAAPFGLSGLGAALLVFFAKANPQSAGAVRHTLGGLLLIAAAAALFAAGLAYGLGVTSQMDVLRLVGDSLVFGIAAVTMAAGLRERSGQDAHSLRAALAMADISSLEAFLGALADQPLLSGLRLAEGDQLEEYDPARLGALLQTRPVWTRGDLADAGLAEQGDGRDELADLMARIEASHAGLISRQPMRIALLTLPDLGAADGGQTEFALFCRLASMAGGGCA